jgi:hypothetical protein
MESGDLMIGSKVNLDIRTILAELNLSMEQLERENVLESPKNIPVNLAYKDSFKLVPESYHKENHLPSYSR